MLAEERPEITSPTDRGLDRRGAAQSREASPPAARLPSEPDFVNEHPRQQEHQGHLPGFHRQAGHVPRRAVPRRTAPRSSAASRRARAARSTSSLPVFDTVARSRRARPAPTRQHDLRAAAVRGRRDPGSGRRRHRAHRLHHRRHPGARHGARSRPRCKGYEHACSSARTAPASSRRASARSASCRATSTSRARSASCRAPAR